MDEPNNPHPVHALSQAILLFVRYVYVGLGGATIMIIQANDRGGEETPSVTVQYMKGRSERAIFAARRTDRAHR
jgi:hypothetical protein